MKNIERAEQIFEELAVFGVQEVCYCTGNRNSPLIAVLAASQGFRHFPFFEERSAAFFALGRARLVKRPVAVLTTSGTAAAELLPATLEAHYSGVPLLLITADRPRRFRGTGAPQSVEQVDLFAPYASVAVDLDEEDRLSLATWDGRSPAHVNVCFDEPLLDREPIQRRYQVIQRYYPEPFACHPERSEGSHAITRDSSPSAQNDRLKMFFTRVKRPLVILSTLDRMDIPAVKNFLLHLCAPIYVEGPSGLREDHDLDHLVLRTGKGMMDSGQFDGLLRIGGVPTTRLWRDLESRYSDLPILSVSEVPFAGIAKKETLICASPSKIFSAIKVKPVVDSFAACFARDRKVQEELERLFLEESQAEPSLFHRLSRIIPDGAKVYLGNSLPIREWDMAADRHDRKFEIVANRGANGIDGQLSTFFGMCEEGRDNVAIVGDLTAMYDLAAPWIIREMSDIRFSIVVINNGGGMIFARFSDDPIYQNRHQLAFGHWAAMWGMEYERWLEVPPTTLEVARSVIEIVPDPLATTRFWKKYDALRA